MNTTLAETIKTNISGIKFHHTGIEIPPGLPYEKWAYLIEEMSAVEKGFRFWWGDAINYGEHEYGEKYAQALDASGLSYDTLRDYCYVAANVHLSLRNDRLSWTHHKAVANLSATEQARWLDWAESTGSGSSDLRLAVRAEFQAATRTQALPASGCQATNPVQSERVYETAVDIYDQIADDLAGGDSGYNWTAPSHVTAHIPAAMPISLQNDYDGDEWYTPAEYIEAARNVLGEIDLDPATCESAQEVVKAKSYFTKADNSLRNDCPWLGRIWLNPPYSMPLIKEFVSKLINQYETGNIESAIIITNNSSDTGWFHDLLQRYPVCFTRGRVSFWRPNHEDFGTRQGQTLFYLGDNLELFHKEFARFGRIVKAI